MRLASLRTIVAKSIGSQRVPHLSLAGNTFTLVSDAENKKVVTQIDGDGTMYVDVHIVDANIAISKMYYKEKFSTKEDEQVAPTCFSDDGIVPSDQSQEKQCDTCSGCQWNVWGTAVTDMGNKGKACRDMWKTAIVVPTFSKDAIFQMRVPPASLKAWNAYVSSFAEFKFDDGTEWTVGHVITRVYFEPGKQGIINFAAVRQVDEGELAYLGKVHSENLAITHIGLAGGAPALPAPDKKEQKAIASQSVASAVNSGKLQVQDQSRTTELAQQIAQEEEDEEAQALAALNAAREKKLRAQAQQREAEIQHAAQQQKLPGAAKAAPSAKAAMQGGSKAGLASIAGGGSAKAAMLGGAKTAKAGVVELEPGMRTVSKPKASMIQSNVEEAEIVEEEQEEVKTVQNSSVTGIPKTQLPGALNDMLASIMGK